MKKYELCVRPLYISRVNQFRRIWSDRWERQRERGVKVRPRGCTLRDRRARGKGPIVKGGRGHYWERERERLRERSKRKRKTKWNSRAYDLLGCGRRSRKMFPFENNACGINIISCRTFCVTRHYERYVYYYKRILLYFYSPIVDQKKYIMY